MEATKFARECYRNMTIQQRPHMTLLYDFDGQSSLVLGLNESIWTHFIEKDEINLSWMANDIHVWYTPLRKNFYNVTDMRNIVSQWRRVASFKLRGV
jgi:hypothetical protein